LVAKLLPAVFDFTASHEQRASRAIWACEQICDHFRAMKRKKTVVTGFFEH
jgi:hypothetical protein